jgi:hypothetical protein
MYPVIIPNSSIEMVISIKFAYLTVSGNSALGDKSINPTDKYTKHTPVTNTVLLLSTMLFIGITQAPNNIPFSI